MDRIDLDIDVPRTLLTAQDLGGFNRAAVQLGRSQSAISLRMRKLEDQIGQKLFRKDGRGLVVTGVGEMVLRYARELVALNDRAVTALRGAAVEGAVRFGMPSDFAESGCRRRWASSSAPMAPCRSRPASIAISSCSSGSTAASSTSPSLSARPTARTRR